MINLIKAEIYKYIHRPFLYIFTLVISAIILLVELLLSSESGSRIFIFSYVCPFGINVALMLIGIFSFVFSEEYKYNSFKNLITSNISRGKLYLGKVLVQIIIIFFLGMVIIGVFCVGLFLLKPGDGYSNDILIQELLKIIALVPTFLAGLSLCNLLIILTRRENTALSLYMAFFFLFAEFINLLSKTLWSNLIIINSYLFQTQTSIMGDLSTTNTNIIHALLVGILNFIIFTILGGVAFNKSEIK